MNRFFRRTAAAVLSAALALSCVMPVFAAPAAVREVTTVIGDGLTLTQHNSRTGSARRQSFTLDFTPGGAVQPLVLYGDELYGKSTVNTVISYAQKQGWHVLAAVNADFFFTSSGVPCGMTIQNGRLVGSDGMWNAVGFFADGTAIVDTPRLSITLENTTTGQSWPIYALNKVRTNNGLYLYSRDFDKVTRTTAAGTEAVLVLDDPESALSLGESLSATVLSVEQAKNTPIKEGQLVLSLTDANTAGLSLSEMLTPGDSLTITPATPDERWNDVVWASGGGNIIAREGAYTSDVYEAGTAPRTLLGLRADGSIRILECDGRQSNLSAGLTLQEGADLLLEQGCLTVINLDGGGSSITAAAYPGQTPSVLSSPSDGAPRAGATYLLFAAKGEPEDLPSGSVVYPRSAALLCGATLNVSATAYDATFQSFWPVDSALLQADAPLENGLLTAPDIPGTVTVTAGDHSQTAVYTVTDTPDRLQLTADGHLLHNLTLDRNRTADLDVLAYDTLGSLVCQDSQFTFTVTGDVGAVDENGLFTASNRLGTGELTVSYGDLTHTIPVTVTGKTARLLEGFESGIGCGTFGSALSSAAVTTERTDVRYGEAALSLSYFGLTDEDAEYLLSAPIDPEGASHLTLSARGTGSWSFLWQLENGDVSTVPFALSGDGWQTIDSPVPEGAQTLLGFTCAGEGDFFLLLDNLTGHFGGVVEDVTPPDIALTLTDGLLTAQVTDSGEMPLTVEDVTVTIDGVPAAFTFEGDLLTCALPADNALHRITVTARDALGNLTRKSADTGTLESVFADLSGHWAAPYAQYLYQKGVFSPAVNFDPNTAVTNEMAATMLSRYLGADTELYADVELPFLDAERIADWALPHVKVMYAMGILKGTTDSLGRPILNPQGSCTRAQVMTILGRTLERGWAYDPCTFSDAHLIPSWAADHIHLLTSIGVITGNDTGTVDPLGTITRAQFAALLYRMD